MGKALVRAAGKDFLHLITGRNYFGTVRDPEYIPVEKMYLNKKSTCFVSINIIKPSMTKHVISALFKTKMHPSHPRSLHESHKMVFAGSV